MKKPAAFLTKLRLEQITEEDWLVLAPLRYYSAVLDREILVPEGFVSDLASVPKAPFIYWFAGGRAAAPAVLHDWLYRTDSQMVTRAQADAVLAEAMGVRGYWVVRSWFMWAGVRLGGHWSFETRSKMELAVNSESAPLIPPPEPPPPP